MYIHIYIIRITVYNIYIYIYRYSCIYIYYISQLPLGLCCWIIIRWAPWRPDRERGEVHHVQRSLAHLVKLGVADSHISMQKKNNEIPVFSVMDVR